MAWQEAKRRMDVTVSDHKREKGQLISDHKREKGQLISAALGALHALRTHLTQTLAGLRSTHGERRGGPGPLDCYAHDVAFFTLSAANLGEQQQQQQRPRSPPRAAAHAGLPSQVKSTARTLDGALITPRE